MGRTIKVNQGNFGTQDLTLNGDLSDLSDHSADEYDDAQLDSTYHTFSATLLWQGSWHWPLNIAWTLTTDFGQRRTYNGKLDTLYFHGGLDLAPDSGRTGDPVLAPADGKVIYTGQLKARGNTIAIDHGLGITSYYFHLSELDVSIGQSVHAGDRLGLVGNTGRSTGPHLHWEVRVQGSIVDPRSFLKQDLSKLP
jgi:murein DD-endopeptidase MepM/ murein hydrolase activator NlpD